MNALKNFGILLLVSVFCFFTLSQGLAQAAQNKTVYSNTTIKPSIKTSRVFVKGNEQSYPAIELNGDGLLHFSFDDLSAEAADYSYQIIHCNADWTVSELFSDEFMDGFNENAIYDYDYSVNTKVSYVHYRVDLPNNEVQFKVSGNYIFRVIESDKPEQTVLMLRFSVYEPLVSVQAEVERPVAADMRNNSQEVRLSITHHQLVINDPFNEVKVVISQNNRPDRTSSDLKPAFVRDNELVYGFSGQPVFSGGNEFYIINFSDIHRGGLNINQLEYVDSMYHVQVKLHERRSYKHYFWEEDMNGKYLINLNSGLDSWKSADYAWVHFDLLMPEPMLSGKLYVYGSFNQWLLLPENELTYNFNTKTYQTKMLLKQGYYNYVFVYSDTYSKTIDESLLEGSHYETENDYLIWVYHRDFSLNYDRLVGYQVINSKYN
ncbi:MAG: DUF5103 domain-containing protein [Salinivirgaceae bacterium]